MNWIPLLIATFISLTSAQNYCNSYCYSAITCYRCNCKPCNPTTTTTTAPEVTPTIIPPGRPSVSGSNSSALATQDLDARLTNTVNLSNVVNNLNRINIPISIETSNINHAFISVTSRPGTPIIPTTSTTTPRVPTLPPIVMTTQPTPTTTDKCCVVVTPCVTHECQPERSACGSQCVQPVVYRPYNPCPSYGCVVQRPSWRRTVCQTSYNSWMPSCRERVQDCSRCSINYYQTYQQYQQCYGCFSYSSPVSFGGGGYGGGYEGGGYGGGGYEGGGYGGYGGGYEVGGYGGGNYGGGYCGTGNCK